MRDLIRQKIVDSLSLKVPPHTRRDIVHPSIPGKAIAAIGMRRSGKSTYLWQVLGDRLKKHAPRESLLYFSFEDERLLGMTVGQLQLIPEEYFRLYPDLRGRKGVVFFLDEIQLVPSWESFVRRLIDTEKIELFLSGSSSKLLSKDVATAMRGRALETLVHPFSFREYLRHVGREPKGATNRLTSSEKSRLDHELHAYIVNGGFPESVGASPGDRNVLLRSYIDTALLRDVVERHAVSHPMALRWLIRHLLSNAAGSFSVNKFYDDLRSQGLSVAKDTLYEYLAHLEDAFLIRTVSLSTGSERRRMVNLRKAYPVDPGLIPIYDRSGRANIGHALETCVMIELERRKGEVGYVKNNDGTEVDFHFQPQTGKAQLLQVSAALDNPDVLERELKGLDSAPMKRSASLHLISLDNRAPSGIPRNIRWHSASDWLLGGDA